MPTYYNKLTDCAVKIDAKNYDNDAHLASKTNEYRAYGFLSREEFYDYTEKQKRKEEENIKKKIIASIKIIVPNKVVEVYFADNQKEKMVCHEKDVFDLRSCLFIAMAKHLYKKTLTYEGIEFKAKELTYEKEAVKIVDSALKEFCRSEAFIRAEEERIKKAEEISKKKKAKLIAYKQKRRAKKEAVERERLIEIQKEAYIRAMECMETQGL